MFKKCSTILSGLCYFHTDELVGSLASHLTIQNLSVFVLKVKFQLYDLLNIPSPHGEEE